MLNSLDDDPVDIERVGGLGHHRRIWPVDLNRSDRELLTVEL